ncbi:MAG: hypothetical protein IKA18_00150 [Clostridia bacterium]|nr:hypothetical protein [Clostridia bacterium]
MKLRKVLSSVLILLLCACTFMPSVAFAKEDQKVWVGGCVIGIELNVDGIAVVGEKEGCKLIVGDVIKSVDNVPVNSVIELKNALKTDKEEIVVKVLREGKLMEITCPLSLKKGVKTLGVLVREDIRGVGTLTFTRPDKRFVALGHQVSSGKCKTPTQIVGGNVCSALVLGVNKGERNKAGELKAVFVEGEIKGEVFENKRTGIYGKCDGIYKSQIYPELVEVATIDQIKVGKATILSCVDGKKVEEYEIEIVSKNYQQKSEEKGLVVKITDQRLIDKVGGIVQGMSGSPIMQDGKLVGAITHVFLNDSTRGFGIFAQNLLK